MESASPVICLYGGLCESQKTPDVLQRLWEIENLLMRIRRISPDWELTAAEQRSVLTLPDELVGETVEDASL